MTASAPMPSRSRPCRTWVSPASPTATGWSAAFRAGERQSLAIARAVHFGARVLILDEPTAALGVKQATHVLRIVNEAKRRGLAVVFITHQVMHAMAVATTSPS